MANWRRRMTHQVQTDINELAYAATEFASEQIATVGQFAPFARALSLDGQVQAVAPSAAGVGKSEISDQLDAQWQALTELKDTVRAVAVAVHVTVPDEDRDGVEVTAEHQDGVAIGLVFRYTVGADRIPEFEPPLAYQEEARIWIY